MANSNVNNDPQRKTKQAKPKPPDKSNNDVNTLVDAWLFCATVHFVLKYSACPPSAAENPNNIKPILAITSEATTFIRVFS